MPSPHAVYVSIPKTYQELTPQEHAVVFANGVIGNPYSIDDTIFYAVPVDVWTASRKDLSAADDALKSDYPVQPCDSKVATLEKIADKTERARNTGIAVAATGILGGGAAFYTAQAVAKKSLEAKMPNAAVYGGGGLMAVGLLAAFATLKMQHAFERCKQSLFNAKQEADTHKKEAKRIVGSRLSYDSRYLIN